MKHPHFSAHHFRLVLLAIFAYIATVATCVQPFYNKREGDWCNRQEQMQYAWEINAWWFREGKFLRQLLVSIRKMMMMISILRKKLYYRDSASALDPLIYVFFHLSIAFEREREGKGVLSLPILSDPMFAGSASIAYIRLYFHISCSLLLCTYLVCFIALFVRKNTSVFLSQRSKEQNKPNIFFCYSRL